MSDLVGTQIVGFVTHMLIFVTEKPDFEGGLILRRGCTAEHVVSQI